MKKLYFFILLLVGPFSFSQNFTDTKGELQISASGTATYNLPIAMPPSIKGVAPVINLTYSSGIRGGIAGQGWNINSISAISRISTRRDIDGFVDGVDFDDNDKLALDGQRLLIKTGTYWANGSTYETEYKSNTKIELITIGSITGFIVTAPDGSRSWYGYRETAGYTSSKSVNSWYISRYEDTYGNFIDYNYKTVTYGNINYTLYIDSIVFSGNGTVGIAAQDKIVFNYKDAKRVERDYLGGVPIYASKILDNIQVFANNAIFRTYKLTHTADTDSGYERLTSLKEINAQNEESNPVVFEYEKSPAIQERTESVYTNNLNFDKIDLAGDFDGDGRLDFVANNQVFTNLFNESAGNTPINLPFYSSSRGSFVATTLTNDKQNQFNSIITTLTDLTSITFNCYNLNNNVVNLVNSKSVSIPNVVYNEIQCTSEGGGGEVQSKSVATASTYEYPELINFNNHYIEGDFNGDGISEVIILQYHQVDHYGMDGPCQSPHGEALDCNCIFKNSSIGNCNNKAYLLNLAPNASTELNTKDFVFMPDFSFCKEYENKFVADFNSDGKTDVLFVNNTTKNYRIVTIRQLTTAPWYAIEIIGSGTLDKYSTTKQILLGDYNGDGKTDLMLPDTEGGEGIYYENTLWHIYYSNPKPAGGEFFTKESHTITEYWPTTGSKYKTQVHYSNYYAMDINKDGKSDFVRVWRKYLKDDWTINNHDTEWKITGFTNNIGKVGASGFALTHDIDTYRSGSPVVPIPIVSNYRYNGANTDLVLVRGHDKKIDYYQFNKNVNTENRLLSVTEASGNIKQTIEYKPMEAADFKLGNPQTDFYSSADAVTYPNIEIIRNSESYLVSKLTATINGVSKYQDFRYRGYVSNYNYGTVGFTRTTRSSWYLSDSDPKIWTTQYNDANLRGANIITWSSSGALVSLLDTPASGSSLLSTKTNVFATNTKGGGDAVSASNVQDELTITQPVTVGQTYKANISITASSKIENDLAVNYQSPEIVLKPGFIASAVNNSKFTASPTAAQGGSNAPASNNGVYNVLLTKQTTIDHLSGIKSETVFSYDGAPDSPSYYGLETRSVTKKYSGATLQGTTIVDTDYDNNPTGVGSAYYIGRPKKVNTSTNIYSGDTRTSEESYTYTGTNLTRTERKGHNTYAIVEDMTYDTVGNLLTKTVSAPTASPAPAARKIIDEYDATKRFVVKKTDHQNFVTTFAYNALGQVVQSKNYLGVISDFTFDNWGKLTKTKTTGVSDTPLETTIAYAKLSDGGYTTTSQNTVGDNAKSSTRYDVLGRAVVTTTKGLAVNSTISKQVVYDGLGRKTKESEPYFSSPTRWTVYEYDYLMRPTKITQPTGRVQSFLYNVLTTHNIDDGRDTQTTIDALGNKVKTVDFAGGIINFTYYANGQLKETYLNYINHKVSINIDGWGNKIAMTDPNAGTYTYSYDAFGQLIGETTPKGKTDTTYDPFGKVTQKKVSGEGADIITDYAYNSFAQVVSETSKSSTGTPIDTFAYTFDALHRVITNTESNTNFTQTKTISYDSYGRPIKATNDTQELTSGLSTSVTTKNVYNTYNGIMDKLTDGNDAVLWQLDTANEKMQSLTETLGNGVVITNAYETNGYFTSQKHSKNSIDIINNTYSFNAVKGTLTNRQNVALGTNEAFSYDNFDRLLNWTNPLTGITDSNRYDTFGRITNNNKLGAISYNTVTATGVYRKKEIALTTEGENYYKDLPKQLVTYNMFKSPISINESDKGATLFTYNSHLSRQTMQFGYQVATKTYAKTKNYTDDGTVEIIKTPTTITIRTFVGGDAYGAPLYIDKIKTISSGSIEDKKYYLHRDYLGSIIAISDATGIAVERRQFDAWGNLAKLQQNGVAIALPTNGTGAGLMMLDRGYTSHEHLAEVGLIHMNGRLYDPVLRSFLMPDNFVQNPENTQNYNRYAYVLNNPLKYIDPSGEYGIGAFGTAVIIGAVIAATAYTLTALLADVPFSVGGLAKSAFIGAASAAVTFGIGTAASTITNFYVRAAVSAVAHGTFQGGMTAIQGGKFWSGFASGALSSIAASAFGQGVNHEGINASGEMINPTQVWGGAGNFANSGVGMIAFGTVSGGAGAALTGGNFWQGAATGLVVSGLNHYVHMLEVDNIEEGLKEYYAIVTGESTDNQSEAQGIGEVILRRLELKGKIISKGFVKYIGGKGQFDAVGGKAYNEIMKLSLSEIKSIGTTPNADYQLRVAGATCALIHPQSNVSNGAYFWNATSQKNWADKGFNWRAYNKRTFTIAKEIGQTTFFKYSDSSKHWP